MHSEKKPRVMEFSCARIRLITNPGLPWVIPYLELKVLPPESSSVPGKPGH